MAPRRSRARTLAACAAFVALALALGGGRVATAGVLLLRSGDLAPYRAAETGFRAAYRDPIAALDVSTGDPAQLKKRALDARPSVVLAIGVRAAVFARDYLPRTPIVYCAVPNPERHDLVGDWIAGVRCDVDPARELAALRRTNPTIRSVGYFYGAQSDRGALERARNAARATDTRFVEAPLVGASDLPRVARRLAGTVDALWLPADPLVANPEAFRFLLELSLESRRPLLAFSDALVRQGALLAVTPDYSEAGVLAAQLVRRVEAGDRPGDLPAMSVSRMRIVVNQATARAMGAPLDSSARQTMEVVP